MMVDGEDASGRESDERPSWWTGTASYGGRREGEGPGQRRAREQREGKGEGVRVRYRVEGLIGREIHFLVAATDLD